MKTWKQNRPAKLKFSYKEQKEYETIDQDIADLEAKIEKLDQDILTNATNSGKLNELTKKRRGGNASGRKDGPLGIFKRSGGKDRGAEKWIRNKTETHITTLCYIEKDDSYLMLHRVSKKNDVNKDKWIGIGGHFEEGEARRSVF